ncbi:hypothetical protein HYV79_03205, partial [Candidatus Woesearchaeota archaeon]|nr:hypothetical protein [Candidatus Woesearchaeota archaeon]
MKYWYILIVVFVALVGLFFMKTALSPTGLYYHYDEDYVDPVCGPGATISWEADPCKNVEDGVWMRWGTPYTPGMPSNFYYTDYKLENECVSDQEVITYSCVTGGVQHPWMNRPYDAVCTKREVCPQGYSCYNLPPPDNPLLTNYRGICDPDPVCGDGKTEFLKGEVCEYDTDCAMDYTCRQCQCVQGEPVRVDAIKYDPPLDQLKSGDKVHIIIRLIGDASGQKISVNLNGAEVVFTAQQGSTCLVANAQESICSIDAPGTVKYGRNELNVNIVSSGLLTMPFYFDVMLSGAPPIPEDITQILPPYEPPLDDFVVLPPYEPPPEPEPETSTQVLPFICPDVTNIRVTPDPSKLSPGDKIHIIITFDSDASGYDTTFTLNGQSKTIKNIVGDTGYDIKHFSTDAPGTVIKGKNTVVITICDQSFTYIFDVAEKPTPLPIPATPYRFTPVPVVGFKPIQVVVSSREDVLEEGVIPPIKAQLVEPQLTSREHAIISSLLAQEERASLNTLLPGEIKIIKKILQEARYELTPNEVGMVRATVLRS